MMTFYRLLFLFMGLFGLTILPGKAQDVHNNYQFIIKLDPQMKRKMSANELMFDQQEKYVIVNYGNKPTYIVVYEFGLWQPVATFRLTNWVEFSGAYIDYENNQLYIKESRFNSEYYRLDISNSTSDIVACDLTPGGCPVVEPRQSEKEIYSKDKSYYIVINKRNSGEIKVYLKKD